MSCLFWNCRGIGAPLTVLSLGDLLRSKSPELVFLLETKCTKAKVEELKSKWNLNGVSVDRVGISGGLALLWRKDVIVDLLSFSQNHIDVSISLGGFQRWRCTGFYGFADQSLRHRSWDLLRLLATRSDLPWVVGGDFNEILSNEEKEGGVVRADNSMESFRSVLLDCQLADLGFEGYRFTWSNYREAHATVRSRLDRCCATPGWSNYFPDAYVEHLPSTGSDHSPLLLHLRRPIMALGGNRRRPWRFEARWIRREECEGLVHKGWNEGSEGDIFDRILNKTENCRSSFGLLLRGSGQSPAKRIKEVKGRITELSRGSLDAKTKEELTNLKLELEHLYMDEEIYWRQRGKNQWAKEGDRNTRFFHAKASKRKKTNTISGLENTNGEWKDSVEEVERIITDYFGELFRSSEPSAAVMDEVLGYVVLELVICMPSDGCDFRFTNDEQS